MKTWKQVKIFTADEEQSVLIEPTPERDGVRLHVLEEDGESKPFVLYCNKQEATDLANEILKYIENDL